MVYMQCVIIIITMDLDIDFSQIIWDGKGSTFEFSLQILLYGWLCARHYYFYCFLFYCMMYNINCFQMVNYPCIPEMNPICYDV